jgi:hypothetical protein
MYGLKKEDGSTVDHDNEPEDIESAIRKEVDALKSKGTPSSAETFTALKLNVDCLAFVKTTGPIEPDALVKRICQDAKLCSSPKDIKVRYVNRLSPSTIIGRSSESGITETATRVLAPHFELARRRPEVGSQPVVESGVSPRIPECHSPGQAKYEADETADKSPHNSAQTSEKTTVDAMNQPLAVTEPAATLLKPYTVGPERCCLHGPRPY